VGPPKQPVVCKTPLYKPPRRVSDEKTPLKLANETPFSPEIKPLFIGKGRPLKCEPPPNWDKGSFKKVKKG